MATKYSAAGTTIAFGSDITEAASIEWKDGGNALDVTTTADTTKKYIAGVPDPECTVEVLGLLGSSVAGSVAALTVTPTVGAALTIGQALCSDRSVSIGNDGKLSVNYTFKPSANAPP